MKSIKGLSNIALVALLNASPCLAFGQSTQHLSSNEPKAVKSLTPFNHRIKSDTASVTDMLISDRVSEREQSRQDRLKREQDSKDRREQSRQDRLKREQDTGARYEQRRIDQLDREKQAAIERQEIRAQMQKQQEQMELARKQASEEQRKEADRRLKYYESLSPAEKEAYKAKQAAIQKQQNEMAARLFGAVLESALSPRVCQRGSWFTGYTYYER